MDRSAIATIVCLLVSLLVCLLLLYRHHQHHSHGAPSSSNVLLDQLHFAGTQQQLFLDSFRMRGVNEWLTAPVFVAPNAARPTLPPPPPAQVWSPVSPLPLHSNPNPGQDDPHHTIGPTLSSNRHEREEKEDDEDEP